MILTSKIPYDLLYRQFDWNREPFGCPLKHWLWYKSLFCKHILCLKPKKCEGWILDVGGGTGPLFDIFSREEKEKYVNLDLSLYLLRKSKGERVRGMAEYLPFRSEAFCFVVSSEVLEHVNDKIRTLLEINRVLKRNALLVLTTPRLHRDELCNKTRWKIIYYFLSIFSIPFKLRRIVIDKIRKRHIVIPPGVKDEPSDEEWLENVLRDMGFRVTYISRLFVLWKNWVTFPTWLLQIMEKKYGGSALCHALILKALKEA